MSTHADRVRERLVCIARRELDDRTLAPGEAAELLAALDALEREREQMREALERAAYIAEHLYAMIDRETWRATGGDDMQGHYEGDYQAEQVAAEIASWAALAASSAAARTDTEAPEALRPKEPGEFAPDGEEKP